MKTPDIYNELCPSRKVLDIISNKWVILIIEKLAQKNHRFGELKRSIGGISAKVLSHLLKSLEINGLIIRTDHSDIILNVEYALSPLGKSLSQICHIITVWAEQHVHELVLVKEDCV